MKWRSVRWLPALVVVAVPLGWTLAQCGPVDAAQDDEGQAASPARPQERIAELIAERDALLAEREAWREERARLMRENTRLKVELALEQERRVQREGEWLEFTRALSAMEVDRDSLPPPPSFAAAPLEPEPAPVTDPTEEAAARRAEKLRLDLNALLAAEQVFAIDFLEVGRVQDGWTGPVVARLVDDRGHLAGTLAADRLRLEISRAGRAVTLVFEVGWESRGGVRIPFGTPEEEGTQRGGMRRIRLAAVDPAPWIESLPELCDPEDLAPPLDDGRWNLVELRLVLAELLRDQAGEGGWRLVGIGGVVGGTVTDVHLVELDRRGRGLRRLFADRLTIRLRGRGVELTLQDGVVERSGRKAPFIDGRMRIFLPDADPERWKAAGVPGLSLPPPLDDSRR